MWGARAPAGSSADPRSPAAASTGEDSTWEPSPRRECRSRLVLSTEAQGSLAAGLSVHSPGLCGQQSHEDMGLWAVTRLPLGARGGGRGAPSAFPGPEARPATWVPLGRSLSHRCSLFTQIRTAPHQRLVSPRAPHVLGPRARASGPVCDWGAGAEERGPKQALRRVSRCPGCAVP